MADIGLVGLGVMGANLALNMAEKGYSVAVFNRTTEKTDAFVANAGSLAERLTPCRTLTELAEAVEPPRPVERLPGFTEGAVSVQDAAAQRTVECLDLRPGQRILDACAAPGGKTAHLLEREPKLAQLVALDIDGQRLERVGENLQRLGLWTQAAAQVSLQTADGRDPAKWWDGRPFDRILLDAPCSGSGVVRRHPDIKWLRREADLSSLARTQGQLLDALWPLLAEDGRLLYATCSVFPQENEGVIEAFLQRQSEACSVHVPAQPPRRLTRGAQRLTGEDGEDGFYYAVLQRRR